MAIDPKAGMTRKFMTKRAVIGSVVHVARFKELGTVEVRISIGEDLGEVFADDLHGLIDRETLAMLLSRAKQCRDSDEVFLAHINKRPAPVEITP